MLMVSMKFCPFSFASFISFMLFVCYKFFRCLFHCLCLCLALIFYISFYFTSFSIKTLQIRLSFYLYHVFVIISVSLCEFFVLFCFEPSHFYFYRFQMKYCALSYLLCHLLLLRFHYTSKKWIEKLD